MPKQDARQTFPVGMTPKEEQMAQCFAQGMSLIEAYKALHPERTLSDQQAGSGGAIYWRKESVQARTKELQAAAASRVVTKIAYTLEDAMKETDDALAMATASMKAGEMIAAIRLRAELSGVLIKITEKRDKKTPLDDVATADLVDLLKELRKKKADAGEIPVSPAKLTLLKA